MANKKFQEIDLVALTSDGSFIGVKDNGDGTFTDIRVSVAALTTFLLEQTRKTITALDANIGAGGTTLTDPFFTGGLSEIVAYGQSYISGVDFTITGNTMTGINFAFYNNLKLIAKK